MNSEQSLSAPAAPDHNKGGLDKAFGYWNNQSIHGLASMRIGTPIEEETCMFSKLITVEPLDFADPLFEAEPFEGTGGPDEEPNQTLRAWDGASFSGIIRQISQAHWRASAWIRLESLQRTLEQRIGPMNFATLPLAHQWLRRAGGKRGFSSFEILVQPASAQGVSKSIRCRV
jgi:hypothetical protein